ncbi:cysteine-rich venom protein-like [Spodoptera frugiperda]|uniref:Cysteine-rich venom protein-like n=1 Tax=Spodoptera frugiperda TaxID=7108 RepID=A0A9R0ECI8_SPOFR|nr:cysteine-rich venom protein-like [Spodoptera frugiperda]
MKCLKLIVNCDKMRGVVVVLSCVLALAATSSVNYCGAKMCGGKDTHTFCQYPEGPGPNCIEYVKVPLRGREKARLLDRFNSARHKAAGGNLRGFPPAANMLQLHWVEELAREAQRWADQCVPPRRVELHDTCRDLYSTTVGQCVATTMGPIKRIDFMVDKWNRQAMYYNDSIEVYEPPMNDSKYYYGDFAQLYWAKSYMVGCARSRFKINWKGEHKHVDRLVCNVAPAGPAAYGRLWRSQPPTELCPHRAVLSRSWRNLCDYPESSRELEKELKRDERDLSRGKKRKRKKVLRRKTRELEGRPSSRRFEEKGGERSREREDGIEGGREGGREGWREGEKEGRREGGKEGRRVGRRDRERDREREYDDYPVNRDAVRNGIQGDFNGYDYNEASRVAPCMVLVLALSL